ncbi:MAG: DUF1989 domain-containing protein [Granulosicoccus sp.]
MSSDKVTHNQQRVRSAEIGWLYSPEHLGRGLSGRHYFGYQTKKRPRLLRPATPVKLELKAHDLLNIENVDGATPLLILTFDERGNSQFKSIGLAANVQTQCDLNAQGFTVIKQWYRQQGGGVSDESANVAAVCIFDDETVAGEHFTLRVEQDITAWFLIHPSHVYSPERLYSGGMGGSITLDHMRDGAAANPLPDPFGAIRDEFTVPAGTAKAYELNAGETVQIIDVQGQQCSDFMAMNARSLATGKERYIDSTVTRSMTNGAYPIPGMFDKFYDQDLRPLLKLKIDTVGRHDTFAYACTARGYEERGFFGHLNCTDNISHAYAPFGIEPKQAWPAINFFFNSWIDHQDNQLRSDEAWSRPGDYIAMEAMNDLVAVTTACPDDVDPINGWHPTDIHVRIYKKDTPIQHAVAYRPEPESEAILTEHSAFHERTSALTRNFAVARDVWLPSSFESTRTAEEYNACRDAVVVQDMSSLRKFDVIGPDAEKLLQLALTRDMNKLSINRGVYALMCDKTGSVIDDGTLFRLTNETFRWCCGSDDSGLQLKKVAKEEGLNVWIKSLFSAMPNLAIQGPKSRELINRIAFTQAQQTDAEQLRWFGSTIARLYGREGHPFHLTRTGYTGELGYEIFCSADSALPIWDALIDEGKDLGITPMGLEALETIRIEAGLMAANAEFTNDVDAFEAGLGFAVDLKKSDFIGKAALARNLEQPRRVLTGLKFSSQEAPVHGDGLFVGRRQVGVITSATNSPALGCAIAMARIAVEYAHSDEQLEVGKLDGHGKRLEAERCGIPFVDPTRSRARA